MQLKHLFLISLALLVVNAHCQTVVSAGNGVWSDPATWSGGVVPTSINATHIVVNHDVILPTGYTISVYRLVINNRLTLNTGAMLTILDDAIAGIPDLQVTGTLTTDDGAVLNGTTAANTSFESGSVYIHRQGPLGFVPLASWNPNATFIIAGFKASGYINIAHSDGWKQNFGHVVYDCPGQTIFVVDLNGYLRNIAGDFIIRNTNNQTLRLSTTQNPSIQIGGSLIVEGTSEVWFSTNGSNTVVTVQKDFIYRSASTGPSYFTTRGICTMNVAGMFEMNSPGPLRMTSSAADSIGARQATLNLSGNLTIGAGTIIAPPSGSGKGAVVFRGTGTQTVVSSPSGASFQGNLDFRIENGSTVNLGPSVLSSTSGGLYVAGRLVLGSTDPDGAIQLVNKGNIRIPGQRTFENGSVIEYAGTSPQWIGAGHPLNTGVTLVCNNSSDITLNYDLIVNNLLIEQGTVHAGQHNIDIYGNLKLNGGTILQPGTIALRGGQHQHVSVAGETLKDIVLDKTGSSQVTLLGPLNLSGLLSIVSTNTRLNADGYLTLLSVSDDPDGTARVGSLPSGSEISGDVTVQRYMRGEGRIYRYISSPVANASVASLMDDFPVTGTFADPSSGVGINSTSPSFYQYDESKGTLAAGWTPYPSSGLSQDNALEVGRGYAAFIRNAADATIWDVAGRLNQGTISLPVQFTDNGAVSNGWNLVGNPYACTIDWDVTGIDGWIKQNISPIISIRDNGVGGGGTFLYWDGDNSYDDIPNGHIASGQSFWVRATGNNPALTLREGVKVTSDASFYRKREEGIPGFALMLTRDGITDKAFFKIRKGASVERDDWDAVKLENDHFDLSTLLPDNTALAIQARDYYPCKSELIPLGIKDLGEGTYFLSLTTRLDFRNFTYTLIDFYQGTETLLSPDDTIRIVVTTDTASGAFARFALRLDEIIPDAGLSVLASRTVCEHSFTTVTIKQSQAGIYYSLWNKSGKQLTEERVGDGTDLRINLHADSLSAGESVVVVKARAVCQRVDLLKRVVITKEPVPVLRVESMAGFPGSTVILSAGAEKNGIEFNWFETEFSIDTLGHEPEWIVPLLQKRERYYVSGTSSTGCSSQRYPVVASVLEVSNTGVPASTRFIFTDPIESEEARDVFYRGDVNERNLYPNPTTGKIRISGRRSDIRSIQIIPLGDKGVQTGEGYNMPIGAMIDVSFLPEGPYLAIITDHFRSYFIRFIKSDP